jgi:hypothetical protein
MFKQEEASQAQLPSGSGGEPRMAPNFSVVLMSLALFRVRF